MKVQRHQGRLRAVGAEVLFVTFDTERRVRQLLLGDIKPRFPVLIDRLGTTYRRWGLRRAPWWRIWLDPAVWRQYARLLRAGERWRGLGRDVLQLGGDFVVTPEGVVAYSRPQTRDDRPPVRELLDVITALT